MQLQRTHQDIDGGINSSGVLSNALPCNPRHCAEVWSTWGSSWASCCGPGVHRLNCNCRRNLANSGLGVSTNVEPSSKVIPSWNAWEEQGGCSVLGGDGQVRATQPYAGSRLLPCDAPGSLCLAHDPQLYPSGTLSWKGWKPCSSCNCNSDINNRSWLNYSAENTDLTQPSATRATQTYPAWNRWQQQTDSSRPYLGALQSNRSYNKCNTCSGPNALDAGTNTDPFGAVKGVSKIADNMQTWPPCARCSQMYEAGIRDRPRRFVGHRYPGFISERNECSTNPCPVSTDSSYESYLATYGGAGSTRQPTRICGNSTGTKSTSVNASSNAKPFPTWSDWRRSSDFSESYDGRIQPMQRSHSDGVYNFSNNINANARDWIPLSSNTTRPNRTRKCQSCSGIKPQPFSSSIPVAQWRSWPGCGPTCGQNLPKNFHFSGLSSGMKPCSLPCCMTEPSLPNPGSVFCPIC